MKIVHICLQAIFTDGFTYQENVLTKYHKRLGLDVDVITTQWIYNGGEIEKDSRTEYVNEDGVHIIRLPIKGKDDRRRKFIKFEGLYDTLVSLKPDVIFIHGVSFIDINTIVSYIRKFPEVKVYADSHADFSNSATNWISKNILHKIIWRHYARKLIPYVKKFYGVLPARVDFLVEMYGLPADKCELLVMGADDDKVEEAKAAEIRADIRNRYGIGQDDFLIMTGGKIDAAKLQTFLLMEAVKRIENPKVKLIVFGSVADAYKEKIEQLCCGNKVQYIGWVNGEESYKYFAASDLVVFPGRHSVFWEQVAGQGIPMLCKYWKGTTHVDVGGNIQFLTEDTVEEIYEKVLKLADFTQEYQDMKNAALDKGKIAFSYKDIAKRSIE